MKESVNTDDIMLNAKTLVGDVRDYILQRLRDGERKDWQYMSEDEQKSEAADIAEAARHLVRGVVDLIAADGRKTIKAKCEKVEVKDQIKAQLTLSKEDEYRHELFDAAGQSVLIVVADDDNFSGSGPVRGITPDDPELPMTEDEDNEDEEPIEAEFEEEDEDEPIALIAAPCEDEDNEAA